MARRRMWLAFALSLLFSAQASASNVLLVVLDDVGADALSMYRAHLNLPVSDAAPTPTLDSLAANGVTFHRAWANALCAATRATLLTGRYGWRTQVLNHRTFDPANLPPEQSIPELLQAHAAQVGTV